MFSLSSRLRFWLLLTLVVASVGTLAKGQTISGTIVGTVTDQQGGVLAAVGVTATNEETGLTYPGATDVRGMFVIPEVPPGLYRVRAQFSGFQPQEHDSVRVDVNRVTEEDFTLKISSITTVVVVQSTAPMTEINTATEGGDFNQTQIRELPILSRDINNLALLAPGVESVRTFSFASTLVPFSSSGSWGRYNNFIVDSVSNNEPIFGGAAAQFTNADIFSDYAILTGLPKAEFGRDSGATVNVITKSGSSKFHGTAFWLGQYSQLNAMTRADTAAQLTSTPPAYENKVGGTLGGPLGSKKDTFFFLSYQYDGAGTDLSNAFPVIATIPTTSGLTTLRGLTQTPALATMLSYPSISLSGAGGQCFASAPPAPTMGGIAIPSTANPCFFTGGSGTVGTTAGYTGVANPYGAQFGSLDVPEGNLFNVHDHQASARIDRRLNDSNDFYGRYLIDDLNTPQALLEPTGDVAFDDLGQLPDSRSILRQRTQSALLDERLVRGNSLNEVRFSYSRIAQGIGAYNLPANLRLLPSATVTDTFGGFGAYGSNFPSAGSNFTLGQDTSPSVTHSNLYEIQENFSLTRDRHFIKMGADYVRTQSNIINVPSDLGHYFFGKIDNPANLTPGFKSFVTEGTTSTSTNAYSVIQAFPDLMTSSGVITGQGRNELPLRETDVTLFVQDDIHVRQNLNVSAGLRFERFGQPINGILNLNPAAGSPLPTSSGDFGPRIGIAWSPGTDRKMVLRGGYGLMYNQMPLNIPLLMWQSYPISPLITTVTPTLAAANLQGVSASNLPIGSYYPNSPLTLQAINAIKVAGCSTAYNRLTAGPIPLINCSTQDTVASNFTTPYIQTWSMGIQRELSREMMVEVNYVGTKGTRLYQRADMNPFSPGYNAGCLAAGGGANFPGIFPSNCYNPRLNPNRGDITQVTNDGNSTYNGLQASLNTRTLHLQGNALTFTAAYTWSHMIDTDSEIFGPGQRFIQLGNFGDGALTPTGLSSVEATTPFAQVYNELGTQERGNSSYDRRQRFVFSEIWGFPTPSNLTRGAKAILGGWNLNGIGTMQSGQPFSPLNGVPLGNCPDAEGGGDLTNTRPNIGNPSAPISSVALLADTTCRSTSSGYVDLHGNSISPSNAHFVQVPLGTAQGGNAGRNILTGPGIIDFDFALFKQFHWGDTKALEFRWEVYDIFNRPIRGNLLGNVFSSNAQPTPGFAFSSSATAAGITGVTPENAIDAKTTGNVRDFLSTGNMNTGDRTMQVGIHFTF